MPGNKPAPSVAQFGKMVQAEVELGEGRVVNVTLVDEVKTGREREAIKLR